MMALMVGVLIGGVLAYIYAFRKAIPECVKRIRRK